MTLGVQATYRGRGIGACIMLPAPFIRIDDDDLATFNPSDYPFTGSRLLDSVLEAVRRGNKEAATASCPASPPSAATEAGGEQQAPEGGSGGVMVADVYLHVQTSNADALHFYKKFGFANRGIIRHYYRRIEPPDCYVLGLSLAEEGAGYQAQRAALGQAAPTEMIVA